jgi:hypothetical protein
MEVQAIIKRWARRYDERLLDQLTYMPEVTAAEFDRADWMRDWTADLARQLSGLADSPRNYRVELRQVERRDRRDLATAQRIFRRLFFVHARAGLKKPDHHRDHHQDHDPAWQRGRDAPGKRLARLFLAGRYALNPVEPPLFLPEGDDIAHDGQNSPQTGAGQWGEERPAKPGEHVQ